MSTQAVAAVPCEVRDIALAERGKRAIEWAFQSMCVLQGIRKHFIKAQPFAKYRIAACLHVTPETANLMITLRDGGASLMLCAANPCSTHDDVAACLAKDYNIPVFAVHGETADAFSSHIETLIGYQPQIVIDDGCRLIAALHERHVEALPTVLGATEDTADGAARLRAAAKEDQLGFPVFAIGEAVTRQLFDNRYGTGQGTVDAISRVTGLLFAGMTVVVAGFGACGRGVALRAKGLGACVVITEVDPVRALEALMEGYRIISMAEAAPFGDVFITASGNKNVISREHFDKFKNGAILCNAGRPLVEIDIEALGASAYSRRHTRELVEEFAMRDGRRLYVLGDGRLINLTAMDGQTPAVMDISFANHALSAEYLIRNRKSLPKAVIPVPAEINRQVAKMKLEAMSVKIDRLTVEQEQYLANWSEGA